MFNYNMLTSVNRAEEARYYEKMSCTDHGIESKNCLKNHEAVGEIKSLGSNQ